MVLGVLFWRLIEGLKTHFSFFGHLLRICSMLFQALPRRRLVRRRLVSGDGVQVSATFSRPERGRTAVSLAEIHFVLVFSSVFKNVS